MSTPKRILKRRHVVASELLSSDEDGAESKDGGGGCPDSSVDLDSLEGSGSDNFAPRGRRLCNHLPITIDTDESSGSDHLDMVLEQLRTPQRRLRKRSSTPRAVIVVSSDSEAEASPVLKAKTPFRRPRAASCVTPDATRTPGSQCGTRVPKTEVRRRKRSPTCRKVPPRRSPRLLPASGTLEEFLALLSSDVDPRCCTPEVQCFHTSFARHKEELAEKLLHIYCREVFCGKLNAEDLPVEWNVRLTCTAGLCHYKAKGREGAPTCRIELSTKVVDRPDRLRDTLLHELCHAATWILHRQRGGHGGLFRFWADCAARRFPQIPPVTRCHSYRVEVPFVYRCQSCGGCIRRHSRSLDTQRKVCSRCGGRFVLLAAQRGSNVPPVREAPLHQTAAHAVR